MNAVKAKAEYIDVNAYSPLQLIEKIGRTCYKSEEKITDDSAIAFVQGLKNRNHWAMLEHAHVIFKTTTMIGNKLLEELDAYDLYGKHSPDDVSLRDYLNISHIHFEAATCGSKDFYYISGSFRAMLQLLKIADDRDCEVIEVLTNKLNDYCPTVFDDRFLAPNEIYYDIEVLSRSEFIKDVRRIFKDRDGEYCFDGAKEEADRIISKHLVHTVIFTCDRGVSHEFVRHRPCSFGQESTRYCNYSQGKFGNGITVISPLYWDGSNGQPKNKECMQIWKDACEYAEAAY